MSVRRRPEFLRVEPLKSSTFSEFGQVIERPVSGGSLINGGTAARFDGVARLDFGSDGGEPLLSLFEAEAARIPIEVRRLERHVGSSQMFVPLEGQRLLVIVAPRGEQPDCSNVRCFLSDGRQGVNFDAGVWHHPLLALTAGRLLVLANSRAASIDCDLSGSSIGLVLTAEDIEAIPPPAT